MVADGQIIASRRTADEMRESIKPEQFAILLKQASVLGQVGAYFYHCFGKFDFENITLTPPQQTFEGELTLKVGDKTAQFIEVGPPHTTDGTLVNILEERVG